ncbi:MAG: hypothetical protein V5A46_04775 [Haloferacaceae archaeon]
MASLAVALLLLVAAGSTAVAIAHGSLAAAERDALQRDAATDLADGLVSPDASHVRRENVLDRNETRKLTVSEAEALAPGLGNRSFRVRVDGRTLFGRGDPTGGTAVDRLVVLATDDTRTYRLDLADDDAVTIPRRTEKLRIDVESDEGSSVSTVRVNDRVVLHDPSGLNGTATVPVPWTATLRVTLEATGTDATVEITATSETTAKARLEVTVGDGT